MAKIMVVEDEADLRELIVEEVESMGHAAIVACDGQEALATLATTKPDVILSDINMPKLNGCQFRQAILDKFSNLTTVPFIFVSAYAQEDDIADAMDVGADHFVTKPIDFEALGELIQSLVGGDQQAECWNSF